MNKTATALGAAIAATLGAATADAALIDINLRTVISYSGNGQSSGNITSSTATWSYDTVSGALTETSGTYNVRFTTAPTSTLFRHSVVGMVLGAPTATAATFLCTEGNFGAGVGASICGNYSFGANFANESSTSWGPGTASAKTIGGDDINFGPQQAISAYNYFATVSWSGQDLVIANASCNPFAPGNANGCATVGGFNTGYRFQLATPVPAAVWLFGSGLGLLGAIRRRAKA